MCSQKWWPLCVFPGWTIGSPHVEAGKYVDFLTYQLFDLFIPFDWFTGLAIGVSCFVVVGILGGP